MDVQNSIQDLSFVCQSQFLLYSFGMIFLSCWIRQRSGQTLLFGNISNSCAILKKPNGCSAQKFPKEFYGLERAARSGGAERRSARGHAKTGGPLWDKIHPALAAAEVRAGCRAGKSMQKSIDKKKTSRFQLAGQAQ
jgi:hypothetical protein